MQHSQNICLLLDFQSRSVDLCTVENVIHYCHENIYSYIFLYCHLYLPFYSKSPLPFSSPEFISKSVIHSSSNILLLWPLWPMLLSCTAWFRGHCLQSPLGQETRVKEERNTNKQQAGQTSTRNGAGRVDLTLRKGSKLKRHS